MNVNYKCSDIDTYIITHNIMTMCSIWSFDLTSKFSSPTQPHRFFYQGVFQQYPQMCSENDAYFVLDKRLKLPWQMVSQLIKWTDPHLKFQPIDEVTLGVSLSNSVLSFRAAPHAPVGQILALWQHPKRLQIETKQELRQKRTEPTACIS